MINAELKQLHDDAKLLFDRAVRLQRQFESERIIREIEGRDQDPHLRLRLNLFSAEENIASRVANRLWDGIDLIAQHIARNDALTGGSNK